MFTNFQPLDFLQLGSRKIYLQFLVTGGRWENPGTFADDFLQKSFSKSEMKMLITNATFLYGMILNLKTQVWKILTHFVIQ